MVRIARMWYPVYTLGYGRRLGIWMQGCKKKCKNCISPEFRCPDAGTQWKITDILDKIENMQTDGLTVSGGEPFDQPEGLLELVEAFGRKYNKDILVFTGYTLEELQKRHSDVIDKILDNIAVLVDGSYEDEKNDGMGLRGSSNQNIYVWKYKERYQDPEHQKRLMQAVLLQDDSLWMIGIPPK